MPLRIAHRRVIGRIDWVIREFPLWSVVCPPVGQPLRRLLLLRQLRALLGTAAHLCTVVVLKLRTVNPMHAPSVAVLWRG